MPTFYSGQTGDLLIGETELNVTSWDATEEIQLLEITNKGSGGFKETITGIRSLSGSAEITYNDDLPGNPPKVYAGLDAAMTLTLPDDSSFSGDHFQVSNVKYDSPTDGLTTVSFDFEATGAYLRPGEGDEEV